MSEREHVSLRPPPLDPAELAGFPLRVLSPGVALFRVTRAERFPWWFGSQKTGRFDLAPPLGTCYLAEDPLDALLEVIGGDREGGIVSEQLFASRRLHALEVPEPQELADLTQRRAAGPGLTLEIHTVVPYGLPQAWAARFQQAGAEGLRYFLRHDPSAHCGVALFGPTGERTAWPADEGGRIRGGLLDRLADEAGIVVAPIPRLADLRLAEE